MCTKVTSTKYLQSPIVAYAIRFKHDDGTFTSPYFSFFNYKLNERIKAHSDLCEITKLKIGDKVRSGFFHMFLTYKDAKNAKKDMRPLRFVGRDIKLKYKILKIKIYSRQQVYFGNIPSNCDNAGKYTVCAKHIVHLEEATPKKANKRHLCVQ